jgi:hypothetical protein
VYLKLSDDQVIQLSEIVNPSLFPQVIEGAKRAQERKEKRLSRTDKPVEPIGTIWKRDWGGLTFNDVIIIHKEEGFEVNWIDINQKLHVELYQTKKEAFDKAPSTGSAFVRIQIKNLAKYERGQRNPLGY